MNKNKNFITNMFSKKKSWLPSVLIILVIFLLLTFIGKVNPILFFYS